MGDLTIGRFGRQMLAAGALSLALIAAVLALGGLALSHLTLTPPPVRGAASSAAGVYTIATPTTATPFATPQPRAHKASVTATVTFRPAVPVSVPRSRPSAPERTRKTAHREHRTKKRVVRRHLAGKPAAAAPATAIVATATPAPTVHAVKKAQKAPRGPKPKLAAPPPPAPAVSRPPVARGPKPKHPIPPGQAKKLKPASAAPAPAPAAAPPAHANHGRGHGAHGPKAHGH